MSGLHRKASAATLVAALGLFASIASAEVSQKDGVRVKVSGSMSPTELPRKGSAPIAVSVAGKISTARKRSFPQLTEIAIAINRSGKLDTRGIPLCRYGHISPSTTQEALMACGPSQIGQGSFSADVRIPEQSPFPSKGKVLAFNGKFKGKPAIFAHVFGRQPAPTSYVLPFLISKAKGTYGTLLETELPHVTGEWGYVTGISLNLDKRVLSASCPAPSGFTKSSFPLAKTSFAFEGGTTLTSILNRTCRVR